jgi:hypothetical protein
LEESLSIGLSTTNQAIYFQYAPSYSFAHCSSLGCGGCKDYNWQVNGPIKSLVVNGGVIPSDARFVVTGFDIATGVPHHGGTPDPFSESLGARNVMAKVRGENRLLVGLLTDAYRTPVREYLEREHDAEKVIFFDGGGSTKQYVKLAGLARMSEQSRMVPAIVAIRLR